MSYIAADGRVGGKKSWWSQISEFFSTIMLVISLFFSTITNPKSLENRPKRDTKTFAQRNGGRSIRNDGRGGGQRLGSNIRGVCDLGDAKGGVGGG